MNDSRRIDSPQQGPHEKLTEVVHKHLSHPYQKPLQGHNVLAFEELQNTIEQHQAQTLILDSCCGTGYSTYLLAKHHPDALVIGVDQSAKRLGKESDHLLNKRENILYLRANCEDLWRLCAEAQIRFHKHFILYPNPYPKPSQLQKRWHAHPAFPALLALSEHIEVRSNWPVYVEEFAMAWQLADKASLRFQTITHDTPVTLFEKKYAEGGQTLLGASTQELFKPSGI